MTRVTLSGVAFAGGPFFVFYGLDRWTPVFYVLTMKSWMTPEWWAARVTHGAYRGGKETPEHYVWRSMLSRCGNKNSRAYKQYGGRGIKVCKRWSKFENFLSDMGARPTAKHSIERINNNKGYCPSNCVWATNYTQQRNRRNSVLYTDGKFTGVLSDCAAHIGISKPLAWYRIRKWGSFEWNRKWRELKKK